MTNKNIEKIALEGFLLTKMSQLVCSRGVTFRQYAYSKPTPPNVYFMGFLPSGSGKNLAVDLINDYLIPFLKPDIDKQIDDWKNQYFEEKCQPTGDKKIDRENEKQANEDLKRIGKYNLDVANATFQGVYSMATQVDATKSGCINILISEFGDFIDSINAGDQNRKELFESLKDMSDCKIRPRIIAGEARQNLDNIPITALLLSDFERLLDEKNNRYFKKMLQTGFSRRCFLYISKEKDKNKPIGFEEREHAQKRAFNLREDLERIYNRIPQGHTYELNNAAKQMIEDYHSECIDEFNKLKSNNIILASDIESSFWKITKLAVVKHVIDCPEETMVKERYIKEAIEFYKKIQPCLSYVLDKKAETVIDLLKKYLLTWISNGGAPLKRKDIFNQGFVKDYQKFAKWFDDVTPTIFDEIREETGYIISDYTGFGGNTKAIQVYKKG